MQALDVAVDNRAHGPLLVNATGRRMTSYNVQYLVAALARDAGSPSASAPWPGPQPDHRRLGRWRLLRDMQDFARHPTQTTRRCDRSRHALNRHATHAIGHCLAGGT